ncbi:hypothetical protein Q2941_50865 [Bradyrhizobium sp. UFLA05-153]
MAARPLSWLIKMKSRPPWPEYRPIYVNGDVSKPGEYPYRPSTTARQLIAVAGGYDIMHMRMNNPYLESADLRSQYGSLWTEFAKEEARIWRIKNELGDGSQIDHALMKDMSIPFSAISEIVNTETQIFEDEAKRLSAREGVPSAWRPRGRQPGQRASSSAEERKRHISQTSTNCRK